MKKLIIFYLFFSMSLKSQTCTALYSYGANFETVHFFNQSVSANAHYYWNFGDGTSSFFKDPVHEFSENGTFLVTLYINDTLNNCSNYFEQWLNVVKSSTETCVPILDDSIYSSNGNNYVDFINNSISCTNFTPYISTLGNNGFGYYTTYNLPIIPGNWISTLRYYDSQQIRRSSSKTLPWKYDRSKNYQGCSANFEFSVISEDANGQTFLFKAMNKNASSYKWYIIGWGDPIIRTNDTTMFTYPGDINNQSVNLPYQIYLRTQGQSGCVDSLWQSFVIRKKSATYVGLKQFNLENVKIELFPNPITDKLSLEYDQSKINLDKLSILNNLGQVVFTLNKPIQNEEIDLRFLVSGIYYLKVQNTDGQKVFKVIKE